MSKIVDIIPFNGGFERKLPKHITYNGEDIELYNSEQLINEITIQSIEDIYPFFNTDVEYSFRGQANCNWPLKTSIERFFECRTSKIHQTEIEKKIIRKYKSEASIYTAKLGYDPLSQDILDTLSDIQHLGGPTRLLDWTSSFNIALLFAVFNNYSNDCATVFCLRNIVFNGGGINITDICKNMDIPEELKRKFPPPLDKNKLLRFHTPKRKNERLINQKGFFIYPGSVDVPFEKALSYTLNELPIEYYKNDNKNIKEAILRSGLLKINIPKKIIPEIQKYLKKTGVSMKILFPDYYGAIQSLYEIDTDTF